MTAMEKGIPAGGCENVLVRAELVLKLMKDTHLPEHRSSRRSRQPRDQPLELRRHVLSPLDEEVISVPDFLRERLKTEGLPAVKL